MRILVIGGSLVGDGGILDAMRRQYRAQTNTALGVDAILVGQCTLRDHWEILGSKNILTFRAYDAIVFQEKGTHPLDNRKESAEYLRKWGELAATHMIRAFLLQPWKRREHFENPDIVRAIDGAFLAISELSKVPLIPVGQAWDEWESGGGKSLLQEVGNHVNPLGAEITASIILNSVLLAYKS